MGKSVLVRQIEVFGRLRALGLNVETLLNVLRRGASARLACSEFHPPSAPGFFAYAEEVVALREQLCPLGWQADDTSNFCTVVSPNRTQAIAVAAGDAATGDPARDPSTQYPKGPLTVAAVETNQIAFDFAKRRPRSDDEQAGPETWFLLAYATPTELRAELSLPGSVTDSGYITTWPCRIILPTIPLDGTFDLERSRGPSDVDDDSGTIDIDVRKKA